MSRHKDGFEYDEDGRMSGFNRRGQEKKPPEARFELYEDFDCGPCVKVCVYYAFSIKEDLKKLGYRWNAVDEAWQFTKFFETIKEATTWMIEHRSDLQDDLGCEVGTRVSL